MKDAAGLPVTYASVVKPPSEAALAPLPQEQRAELARWTAALQARTVRPSEALRFRVQIEAWLPPGPEQDKLIRWIETMRPHDDDTLPSWMFCEG